MWKEFVNTVGKIEFVNLGIGNYLKISQGDKENEWYCVPTHNTQENKFKIICTLDELRNKLKSKDDISKLLG